MSILEEGKVYDIEWLKANYNGTIYYNDYQAETNDWRLICTTCFGTVSVIANFLLLFIVIFMIDIRKKPSMILVANIAIADLLMVFNRSIYIVLLYTTVGQDMDHTEMYCKFGTGTYILAFTCSSYTLASLAGTRYQGIVRPFGKLSRHPRRFRHILITSALIWIISIILSVPQYILAKNDEDLVSDTHQCQYLPHFTIIAMTHEIMFVTLSYVVPLAIIVFCYGSISHYLRKSSRDLREMDKHSSNVTKVVKKRTHLAKSFICIVVAFSLMYSPSMLSRILIQFQVIGVSTVFYLNGIATIMCYLNTCVNPIMFCFFTKTIRQGIIDIIICRWGRFKLYSVNSTNSTRTTRTRTK